ncbi:hypothetical protein LCGC14_2062750 [marine sediment metagenome]|uniref:ParB/Sulfiredoxin domain-containing protein n=1 Tax=marine sediment metagenome TaxID=412755 RepID=A0A0F9GZ67_9ZZZZ
MKNGNEPRHRIVQRRVDSLRIHPTAQREGLTKAKLRGMVKDFNLDAIGTLHAVQYKIKDRFELWIVDGWHRHAALMELGLGEWEVEVYIHEDVTTDAEASALFLRLNNRAAVSPLDKFVQLYQAGDASAIGVARILSGYGYKVGQTQSDRTSASPAGLLKAYDLDDGSSLNSAFGAAVAAWGHQAPATEGKVVQGLAKLFHIYQDIEVPALVLKLSKYPGGAAALLGAARQERAVKHVTIVGAIFDIARETYNKGRRTRRLS